jgi:hypothetical protein
MQTSSRLPRRFPANTKYVVEAHGAYVRRYVEFPDGRVIELSPRKAQTCHCAEAALVPALPVGKRRRLVAA